MSLVDVRKYFRDRMDTLGFKEWPDGFDFDNIPETIIDKAYHITTGSITQNSQNQTVVDLSYPITIRLFLKGFRNPAIAIDESIFEGEKIILECVNAVNANTLSIKNVMFLNMEPQPLDVSNDNIVVLLLSFEARVLLNPNCS